MLTLEGVVAGYGESQVLNGISFGVGAAQVVTLLGRNGMGNRPPRSIGSSASRLLQYLRGDHYDAKPSEREQRMVRLWIDSGAPYPGTYASLGTGMIGGFEIVDRSIRLDRSEEFRLSRDTVQSRLAAGPRLGPGGTCVGWCCSACCGPSQLHPQLLNRLRNPRRTPRTPPIPRPPRRLRAPPCGSGARPAA